MPFTEIVLIYNKEEWWAGCIDGIRNQSLSNSELLLVGDSFVTMCYNAKVQRRGSKQE